MDNAKGPIFKQNVYYMRATMAAGMIVVLS